MDNVINLKRARQKHNRQKLDAAESVCQYGFKGLLHEISRSKPFFWGTVHLSIGNSLGRQ